MRMAMEDYWKSAHLEGGYELLNTPHMASVDLWKTSGHFDFYKEGMFDQMEVEGADYQLKPMNCPFHCAVYTSRPRSSAPNPPTTGPRLVARDINTRPASTGTRSCRCAGASSARSTATSPPAPSTACCACAASHRSEHPD